MQSSKRNSVTRDGLDSADTTLRRAVLARLISDPRVGTGHLRVAADDGVVTLSGHVTSQAQREAAVATAHRVKGAVRITDDVRIAVPVPAAADSAPDLSSPMRRGSRS
jgi:osmotically-inducible protein OsmY